MIWPSYQSVLTSNPEESPAGVGGSELTDPGNINGSDDPESTLPPVDSPAGATIQSEPGRVSVETSVPNPLTEFINIYSDDESPEASQKTSVHVEEEKGAEEKTPLVPDVQSQEDTREGKGVESGLDTEMPDAPETRAGSPKDKSELDESKERSPQKDVGDATTSIQESIELPPDTSIPLDTQVPDKQWEEAGPSEKNKEVQESDLEQIYTTDSLGNMLTWGDQQIPEPVDEVADIYAISYDQKRKAIVQRTAKKRKITVDHSILVTTEENLINTADARTSELIGMGRALSDAAQDRARRDERELADTLKELEHLRHLVEYYKGATQTATYLKSEFSGVYNEYKKERNLLTENIIEFQEDTLMALATCKEMERWHERALQAVERLEYIEAVQQGREKEEHGIRLIGKSSLDRIKRSTEYWTKMSRDPHREIQEQYAKCQKHWDKINKVMKDIKLPEFGTPSEFIDIRDVLKVYAEQDSLWTEECAKVADARPGQVQQFTEHPIRAKTMLQQLNSTLVKYRAHATDIRGIYAAPMEQHRFPWAQTCEELFINWSEYERSHPFKEISRVD
jgi:hypothetical protein